jgi:hypothetical protein
MRRTAAAGGQQQREGENQHGGARERDLAGAVAHAARRPARESKNECAITGLVACDAARPRAYRPLALVEFFASSPDR